MVGMVRVGGATAPTPLVAQPPTSPAAKRPAKTQTQRRIYLFNARGYAEVSLLVRWRNNKNVAPNVDHEHPAVRIYASSERTLVEDLESVIAAASGGSPEHEPTRVVGRVDLDAFEAHSGTTKSVELYEPSVDEEAPDIPVPPKVRDLDRLMVAPDEVAIVRIVPARDRFAVLAVAFAGLMLAIGFLLFLLAV